jgi:hypothetical protein
MTPEAQCSVSGSAGVAQRLVMSIPLTAANGNVMLVSRGALRSGEKGEPA